MACPAKVYALDHASPLISFLDNHDDERRNARDADKLIVANGEILNVLAPSPESA